MLKEDPERRMDRMGLGLELELLGFGWLNRAGRLIRGRLILDRITGDPGDSQP